MAGPMIADFEDLREMNHDQLPLIIMVFVYSEPASAEPIQLGVRQDVSIRADLGGDVHLPCAASQGNPPPNYA